MGAVVAEAADKEVVARVMEVATAEAVVVEVAVEVAVEVEDLGEADEDSAAEAKEVAAGSVAGEARGEEGACSDHSQHSRSSLDCHIASPVMCPAVPPR